jgi:hypothetical protein
MRRGLKNKVVILNVFEKKRNAKGLKNKVKNSRFNVGTK